MTLHDFFTLLILPIGTSGYDMTQLLPKLTSFPIRIFVFLVLLDFFIYFEKLEKE